MSSRYQFPTSLRYLKARLWFVKRPMFWGASAVLLLATVFIAEYWTQPDWFQTRDNAASSSNGPSEQAANQDGSTTLPPSEDNFIGADIDSLPLLFSEIQDFEPNNLEAIGQDPGELANLFSDSSLTQSENTESDSVSQSTFGSADSYIRLFQPFTSDEDLQNNSDFNLLPSAALSTVPSVPSNSGTEPATFGGSYTSGSPSSTVLGNPLQSALERSLTDNGAPSAPTYGTQTPTSISPQNLPPSVLAVPSGGGVQPNPVSNQPYYQTSPSPGTTGYTVPQTLRMMPDASGNSSTPTGNAIPSVQMPGTGLPNGGYSAPAYTPPPQVSPQSQSSQNTPSAAVVQRTGPMYLPGARQIEVSR